MACSSSRKLNAIWHPWRLADRSPTPSRTTSSNWEPWDHWRTIKMDERIPRKIGGSADRGTFGE